MGEKSNERTAIEEGDSDELILEVGLVNSYVLADCGVALERHVWTDVSLPDSWRCEA